MGLQGREAEGGLLGLPCKGPREEEGQLPLPRRAGQMDRASMEEPWVTAQEGRRSESAGQAR